MAPLREDASHRRDDALLVGEISERIKPFLAGQSPEIQGAVLCDLLSLWLAATHPGLREELLQMHIAFVREMVPSSERQIFGEGGFPMGHI